MKGIFKLTIAIYMVVCTAFFIANFRYTPSAPKSEPKSAPTGEKVPSEVTAFYTPSMTQSELEDYLKPLDVKGADGLKFWDSHWITEIESSWESGAPTFRLRISEAPKAVYKWYWYYNMDREVFLKRLDSMADDNLRLVSSSSYSLPEGTKKYCAVWHWVKKSKS